MRLILLAILFIACNPVKRVLNDPKKFEVVKEAVIRSGACVNDTTIVEVIKDSIIRKDSLIKEMIPVPCKDFDTTFGKTRISVSSGILKYEHTCDKETVIRERVRTNTVRDKSLEDLLKKDIATRDGRISQLEKENKEVKAESRENAADAWLYKVLLIAGGVIGLGVFIRSFIPKLSIFGK